MDNKAIVYVLQELEGALDKDLISYDKHYLIVLRSFLFIHLRGTPNQQSIKAPRQISHLVPLVVRGVTALLKYFFSGKKTLVVAPSAHRNILISGRLYSKAFDSLCWHLEKDRVIGLELGRTNGRSSSLNFSLFVDAICKLLSPRKAEAISTFVSAVAKHLQDRALISGPGEISALEASLHRYEKRVYFFRNFFSLKLIKKAYVVAYYNVDILAMIRALRGLGVPVLEYQHGIQNSYQPMYTHLKSIARVAPESLPSHFLTWNNVTAERINDDISDQGFGVENIGCLWKGFFKTISKSDQPFLYEHEKWNSEKTVLLALQAFPRYFNFEILAALKQLDSGWRVIVREHPLSRLSDQDKRKYFSSNLYEAEIIMDDCAEALDFRLVESFFCITGFSSVGYEASQMGLITVFTHKNALDGLSDYIDEKLVFYRDSADAILDILREDRA